MQPGDAEYFLSSLTTSSKVVIPVKTGIQCFYNMLKFLDTGVHRYDDVGEFSIFDESTNYGGWISEASSTLVCGALRSHALVAVRYGAAPDAPYIYIYI